MVRSRLTVFPTSWLGAGWRLREPGGRPGPGRVGLGALAGRTVRARMFRKLRRTRAGVSRPGRAGRSQGRRRSAASGRARRSWVCAAITSQVQRSAASAVRIFGAVQPRVCLSSRKVCQVEAAQERLPPAVHVGRGGAGGGGPQPHRLRVAVPGQVLDLQPNQGAFDDRQLAGVVDPARAAGQPGVDPVPAGRDRGAVAGGLGRGGVRRFGPGGGPVQGDLRAVAGWAPGRAGRPGRLGQAQDPVRAEPPTSSTGRSART
jgi:hypothetical protein